MKRSQESNKQVVNESNCTIKCSRWTSAEDRALVTIISDLLDLGDWKADNDQFKSSVWAKMESIMEQKLPHCDKKVKPHLEPRVKLLRKQYDAIVEMLSPSASGFGWNDEGKFVTCPKAVWADWMKSHPNAASMRNKSFPLFDELSIIFDKDRATGNESSSTLDALEELEEEEDKGIEAEQVHNVSAEDETTANTQSRQIKTPSTAPSSNRTKKTMTETIETLKDFSSKLEKMSDVMKTASEHIGRLASCFLHESESAGRKIQVISETMKIGKFTIEVLLTSKKIAFNPLKVDFFFSFPDDNKYAYVQDLLLPDHGN